MNRARRRRLTNRLMEVLATVAALIAVAVLAIVVVSVARRGAGALSWDFFTKPQALFGQPGGGIANALVGTALLVLLATGMALPVGVLTAVYLTEFAPKRVAVPVQVVLDVLAGLPTIVVGIFVYALLVIGHTQSGYAGAFALAVIMLPLVARATQEVLLLVPGTLREASLALGVRRWRTVLGIILPSSVGGILTGTVLAIARAAGETAPLLFTSSIFAQLSLNRRNQGSAEHPGPDLHVLGTTRSGAARAGLGGRARADGVRPRREPGRQGLCSRGTGRSWPDEQRDYDAARDRRRPGPAGARAHSERGRLRCSRS